MITQHDIDTAVQDLAALITERDAYVADTHDLNLFVAMWRTFRRNSRIIEMNNRIADQLDYVEEMQERLEAVHTRVPYTVSPDAYAAPYTVSPDAYAVIDDRLFDLIDWLAQHRVTVTGHCDGRTVRTDERVLVVDRDGVEQYRAVCGDATLDHDELRARLNGLDAHLIVNGTVFTHTDPNATEQFIKPLALISDQAREVLNLFAKGDCEVKGEIDGLTVTSARTLNGHMITAQRDSVTVYTVESTGDGQLDRHLIVRAAHGLHAKLQAECGSVTVRLNGNGALTYVSDNHWEVTRLPPRA